MHRHIEISNPAWRRRLPHLLSCSLIRDLFEEPVFRHLPRHRAMEQLDEWLGLFLPPDQVGALLSTIAPDRSAVRIRHDERTQN